MARGPHGFLCIASWPSLGGSISVAERGAVRSPHRLLILSPSPSSSIHRRFGLGNNAEQRPTSESSPTRGKSHTLPLPLEGGITHPAGPRLTVHYIHYIHYITTCAGRSASTPQQNLRFLLLLLLFSLLFLLFLLFFNALYPLLASQAIVLWLRHAALPSC
ncbi:predicted protein [Histoplasma capsulatum G186AR]|uniref:Uncharacterized protein n=1 Tax=Ajellomyces capsulatus (strain G186AR / H82 / ATCC MYA-2454 / RMSCC 2432) TaxID=447093 RepID=C0NX63_AJECG|nr:uncharacterized protein HCBG_08055 [Histoplasma capsulatum G186AR]EEH03929.1 predicted protein [Histoplasma capsulatum G186AR]